MTTPFPAGVAPRIGPGITCRIAAAAVVGMVENACESGMRLDRKLEIWKAGLMKTTLDLPADLVREMKLRAASEGRKLRDVATEIFRRGLLQPSLPSEAPRHRVKLPLIECRAATTEMNPESVAEVLLKQEADWSNEVAGR
jgi:plasmid stability protein